MPVSGDMSIYSRSDTTSYLEIFDSLLVLYGSMVGEHNSALLALPAVPLQHILNLSAGLNLVAEYNGTQRLLHAVQIYSGFYVSLTLPECSIWMEQEQAVYSAPCQQ